MPPTNDPPNFGGAQLPQSLTTVYPAWARYGGCLRGTYQCERTYVISTT